MFIMTVVLFSCDKDDTQEACDTTGITYTNTVASVFNALCALSNCHVDGNEANAKFSLEGYAKAKGAASFGRIVGAISHDANFTAMPFGSDKLDQCTIDKIAAWIADGSPE